MKFVYVYLRIFTAFLVTECVFIEIAHRRTDHISESAIVVCMSVGLASTLAAGFAEIVAALRRGRS
jgi:hypothetical protein